MDTSKASQIKGQIKGTSYHSKKTACSSSAKVFAEKFKSDIVEFVKHKERFRSQYRRIKEIKGIVSDPANKSKLIRVDWSEMCSCFR